MSRKKNERLKLLFSIITRGKSKSYTEMLEKEEIRFHMQMAAFGTAPSEMMDVFGLGSNDKDVVLSLATEGCVTKLLAATGGDLNASTRYGGLMMVTPLTAINRITAEMVSKGVRENTEKGAESEMNNEHKHQLILVSVNQGYTDEVMQTARAAGATGGTIIRARFTGSELLDEFGITGDSEEKEILAILAPTNIAAEIMNDVNREHGMNTDCKGTIFAVPVEKALKI